MDCDTVRAENVLASGGAGRNPSCGSFGLCDFCHTEVSACAHELFATKEDIVTTPRVVLPLLAMI